MLGGPARLILATLTSRRGEKIERTQQFVDAGTVVAAAGLIKGVDGNDLRAGQKAGRAAAGSTGEQGGDRRAVLLA